MSKVLLISNASNVPTQRPALAQFMTSLNQESAANKYQVCMVQDLLFTVLADDINKISIRLNGEELRDTTDVIHLRNLNNYRDYAKALQFYAEYYGMTMINETDAKQPFFGKVSQGFLMALNDIPTPTLLSSASNQTLAAALEARQPAYPLIIKHNNGIKGNDNYLAKTKAESLEILQQEKQDFLVQPFIPNDGELRILRFGAEQAALVFKKQAGVGTHLNNTSQGGDASLMPVEAVEPEIMRQAHRAAELMGRDIAGVDVLLGTDGSFTILEVNSTPSIATGAFQAEKRAYYEAYISKLSTRNEAIA